MQRMFRFFRRGVTSICLVLVAMMCLTAAAQETTGGVEGVVKDSTGANIAGAVVVIEGSGLIGNKTLTTNSSGYYRFINIPSGTYTLTATAKGFTELKRQGLVIE